MTSSEERIYPKTASECHDTIECQDLYIEGLEATVKNQEEKIKKLRGLIKEITDVVEGCHDCINYSASDELLKRIAEVLTPIHIKRG